MPRRPCHWPFLLVRYCRCESSCLNIAHSFMCHNNSVAATQRTRTIIQTLDPSRLRPLDFFDVSSKFHMHVTGPGPGYQPPFRAATTRGTVFQKVLVGSCYYRPPNPGAPSAAGDIRFRLTPGNDPASFIQGTIFECQTVYPGVHLS